MYKKFLIVIIVLFVVFCFYLYGGYSNDFTTKFINYNGSGLQISIDGQSSSILPTSGTYYLADYDCSGSDTKVIWNNDDYTLDITNGKKKNSLACYLEFKTTPLLSEMPVGSYVSYTGNNGCSGNACSGENANYVSDTDMGYCCDDYFKFYVNGWRIGYIEDDNAYLVSAGAPECICTSSNGNASTSCNNSITSSDDIYKHIDNLDAVALKYCNSIYAKGGICDSTTAWAMDATDFQKITGSALSETSCYDKYSDMACGYANDLIDNGGYYWFATPFTSSSSDLFSWYSDTRYVQFDESSYDNGVRPVLKIDSSIIVTGGSGTYEDPYTISVGE